MTTPSEIVRVFKYEWGNSIRSLNAAADYCERLSNGFRLNPWADPSDAANYSEAASRLRSEAELRQSTINQT